MGCGLSIGDRFSSAIILNSDPGQLWNLLSVERENPKQVQLTFLPPEESKKYKIIQDNGTGPHNVIVLNSASPLLASVLVVQNVAGTALPKPDDSLRVQMLKMLVNHGMNVQMSERKNNVGSSSSSSVENIVGADGQVVQRNTTTNQQQQGSFCGTLSPLHAACMNFFPECVRYLHVSQKANVFFGDVITTENPLSFRNYNNRNAISFVCRAHRESQLFYLSSEEQTDALAKIAEIIITRDVVEKINLTLSRTDYENSMNTEHFSHRQEAFSLFLATITIQEVNLLNSNNNNVNNASDQNVIINNGMPIYYGPALTAAARQFLKHGLMLHHYAPLLTSTNCPLWPEIQRLSPNQQMLQQFNTSSREVIIQETSASSIPESEKTALVKTIVHSAMGLVARESGIFTNSFNDSGNLDFSSTSSSLQSEALCYHLETEINQIGVSSFLVGVRQVKGCLVELVRKKILNYISSRSNNNNTGPHQHGQESFLSSEVNKKSFAFEMRREVEMFLKIFNARVQLAHQHQGQGVNGVSYEEIGKDILNQM